jgi:hypothetical protein
MYSINIEVTLGERYFVTPEDDDEDDGGRLRCDYYQQILISPTEAGKFSENRELMHAKLDEAIDRILSQMKMTTQ